MANYNNIILIGNVGTIEIKTFSNGGKIAEVSLATTERWTDKQGEKREETQWHRLVIGGPQADIAERYIKKGDPLMVAGKMKYRQYEKQGLTMTVAEVRVDTLQLLTKPAQASAPAPATAPRQAVPQPKTAGPLVDESGLEFNPEDLPF